MLRCRNGFAALRHMVGGAGGIELLRLLIWRGNRSRRFRDGLDFLGRPGFARGRLRLIRPRRRGGRVRRNGCGVRLSQEARHEACDFVLADRPEARHCAGRVEVPRILGQADEVADHRIG